MSYDHWKTTEPIEDLGDLHQCECCGVHLVERDEAICGQCIEEMAEDGLSELQRLKAKYDVA